MPPSPTLTSHSEKFELGSCMPNSCSANITTSWAVVSLCTSRYLHVWSDLYTFNAEDGVDTPESFRPYSMSRTGSGIRNWGVGSNPPPTLSTRSSDFCDWSRSARSKPFLRSIFSLLESPSALDSMPLNAHRLLLTVMLRCVVPIRISSARAHVTCSKLCPFTSSIWSPRFRPASYAFVFGSTRVIKMPPWPPEIWKLRSSSRALRASVTFLSRALCCAYTCNNRSCSSMFFFSSADSNISRNSIICGSVSKSVK
uniref:Uncharacterized protein n=1 Tax=Anopheles farauti TaxID=69004 RepID=A0A182Q5Z5_9DIPT